MAELKYSLKSDMQYASGLACNVYGSGWGKRDLLFDKTINIPCVDLLITDQTCEEITKARTINTNLNSQTLRIVSSYGQADGMKRNLFTINCLSLSRQININLTVEGLVGLFFFVNFLVWNLWYSLNGEQNRI